jgi:hypothetical protein
MGILGERGALRDLFPKQHPDPADFTVMMAKTVVRKVSLNAEKSCVVFTL